MNKQKTKLKSQPSDFIFEDNIRENICFTINPTNSGFTDQMMQFSAFYKLGRTLGLNYLHTPFKASRSEAIYPKKWWQLVSKKSKDIYNYLGFNQYMLERSEGKAWSDAKRVDVNIGNHFSHNGEITFAEIIDHVQKQIDILYKQNDEKRILFCFRLNASRAFFSVIHQYQHDLPDNLNLRKAFLQKNNKGVQKTVYKKPDIKILFHIRQGDTAVLKTPWKTYIPVYGGRPGYLQEHQTLSAIDSTNNKDVGPIFSINEYHAFFSDFMKEINLASSSVKLFSDGFFRAFNKIFSGSDRHSLTEEQIKTLKKVSGSYDKKQFSRFNDTHKIECFIGEREEYLQHLIRAVLETDIVIMGFQQRMLPKFLANYRLDNMPLVIVLHKGDLPDYSEVAHGWEDSFIFIDIHKPDYNLLRLKLEPILLNTVVDRNIRYIPDKFYASKTNEIRWETREKNNMAILGNKRA